ncbi:MAG: long-chain fatty acid--CoA ligase [Pseudomonadota bacterium]
MNSFINFLPLHANKHPDKTAIIFNDKRFSYRMLNSRVNKLSNAFNALGVSKGDRVAILLHNGNEIVESVYACAKIGAVSISLNFRLVGRELVYILDDSDASVIIYGQEFIEIIDSIRAKLDKTKNFILVSEEENCSNILSYEAFINAHSAEEPQISISLEDESSIIYTSGTTGKPKGVVRTHRANLWASLNQILEMGHQAKDIEMYVVPLFNVGFFNYFTPNIIVGATVVVSRQFDPVNVLKNIEEEKVNRIFMVPIMWNRLMSEMGNHDYDVSSLNVASSGAASCPLSVKKTMEAFFPGIQIWEAYGLSEGGVTLLHPKDSIRKIGSVGKPTATNEARVVDDHGNDVKQDQIGEIIFRGPSLMKEYYKNFQATRDAFKQGWLHTGDLAKVDEDGFIYVVDRKKDMIVSGGENIYPKEIEEILFSHPKIFEAAVIGIPDEKWGESVMAVVVLKAGEHLTSEEVISFCKENLAGYKKPKFVEFVDALPTNPSGKVVKHELKSQFAKV